jgi:hypothetical protein
LNNASFLYTAMLESGPWRGRSSHVANGLLLATLLAASAASVRRLWRRERSRLAEDLFLATLLAPAIFLALGKDVPNPKTDLPAGLMTFMTALATLRFVTAPSSDARHQSARLVDIALLASAAICLKLSAAVVVVTFGAVALVVHLRRPARKLPLASLAGVGALLIGPWIARNIVLSGYPLYPSTLLAAPVGWRVPKSAAKELSTAIIKQSRGDLVLWAYDSLTKSPFASYARLLKPPFEKSEQIRGFNWVRPWLFSLPMTSAIEVVLPAIISLIAIIAVVRTGGTILLVAPLAGVIFWFFAAPEPRFGWQMFWTLAATSVALSAKGPSLSPRIIAVIALLLTLPAIAYRAGVLAILRHGNIIREIPLILPGSDHGFHPMPTQTFKTAQTRWGTTIYIPDSDDTLTWDGPLPCTGWPPLDRDLRLRRPGDLSSGFVIDHSPR